MVSGTIAIRFKVTDDTGVDTASVSATVEGVVGDLSLTSVNANTYQGSVDSAQFSAGLSFPLITVQADDVDGNHSVGLRRFGVDKRRLASTWVSDHKVAAGETITVTCSFRRGLTVLSGISTEVVVTPTVAGLAVTGQTATFTPTATGKYRVKCGEVGGAAMDAAGQEVVVEAAALASVETVIAEPTGRVGTRIITQCRGLDTYGNQLLSLGGVSVQVPNNVESQHLGGQLFSVTRYTVGKFNVACASSGKVDSTPVQVTLSAGEAARSATKVSVNGATAVKEATAQPTDTLTVQCVPKDAYGNVVSGVTTKYSVIPADGQPMTTYKVIKTGSTFTATKAGYLYVVCGVEGTYAEDDTPARVHVTPGLPMTWSVNLLDQDCYWADRRLPLAIDVYDYWGNRVANPAVTVSTVPSGGIIAENNGRYSVGDSDGDYAITATIGGSHHAGANLPDFTGDIRVDSTPPLISITSPLRGATLESGTMEDSDVSITGSISDSVSPLKSATFNDQAVSIGGKQKTVALSRNQSSRWGLSMITVEAEDECGNFSVLAQSYLRSPAYSPLSPDPADPQNPVDPAVQVKPEAVGQALTAQFNQVIIDDGDRADNDDVASLGEAVALNTDLDARLPDILMITPDSNGDGQIDTYKTCIGKTTWYGGHKVTKNGTFTYSNPRVEYIKAVSGGLKVKMTIDDMRLPIYVEKTVEPGFCILSNKFEKAGTALLEQATLEGTGAMALAGGKADANFSGVSVNLYHPDAAAGLPYLDIEWWEPIDDILDSVLNSIAGTLVPSLKDGIALTRLEPLVEDFFSNFSLATSFTVPAPVNMTINLESGFDYLAFSGPENSGNAGVGLYAQVFPSSRGANIDATARGPIRRNGDRPTFSSSDYAFGLALKDDLVNQALWAVWYGGGLDLDDATSLLSSGMDNVELSIQFKSPPVMMPGRATNQSEAGISGPHEVDLGVGDIYIDASVDIPEFGDVDVSMHVSAILGGFIDLKSSTNELILGLDGSNPLVWVQIDSIGEPALQGRVSVLFTEVIRALLPKLLKSVVKKIPLPVVDVGGLAGLPQSEIWELSDGDIDRLSMHYRFTGSLR